MQNETQIWQLSLIQKPENEGSSSTGVDDPHVDKVRHPSEQVPAVESVLSVQKGLGESVSEKYCSDINPLCSKQAE